MSIIATMLLASTQAQAQIAPGVTQSAAHTANLSGTVTKADGTPVSGADVKLHGPAILSAKTDDRGTFTLTSVPWGIYQISVTSGLGTATRSDVAISGDINVSIQYAQRSDLRTIANVSTGGAGAHINVTSSSITSVTPSEYAFQGNGTWTQLFAQVPGVAPSGYTYGGDATTMSTQGSPQTPVVLSLNGALPYETSTTLDGMPLQGTTFAVLGAAVGGGFDLSSLPINAFDTADIVRGPGANAPSIVDSIGGSFVLHGPGLVNASHFEFNASNDPYGGIISNAKAQFRVGRLAATLIYGVNDSPGPLGTKSVLTTSFASPATIGGQPVNQPTTGENANGQGITNCYCTFSNTLLYKGPPLQSSTAWTAHNGAADLAYEIAPSVTVEMFYAAGTSIVNDLAGNYPLNFAPSVAVPPYSGSLAASPGMATNYSLLTAQASQPIEEATSLLEEKLTAYIGSGVLRIAALQNNTYNSLNYYDTAPNGTYQVWGTANVGTPGTTTAYNGTSQALTFSPLTIDSHAWTNNRDLLGSYAIELGPKSSAGVSYTQSYYNAPNYLTIDYGGGPLPAISQSTAVSETTRETRLHVDTALSKLALDASWYFANGSFHVPSPITAGAFSNLSFPYSAPRLGAVWSASSDIAIRASAGGGYALPTLTNVTGSPPAYEAPEYLQTIPNPNIKPEESFGFDVGADTRIQRNTVVSLDLYRTNLYGQFFTSTTSSTFQGSPLYITQFGNLGTSRMEGINLDAKRDVTSGYYWRGTLGFTRGYALSLPAGVYNNPSIPCTNCTNQGLIPGPNFNSASGFLATVPYTSASAQLGYKWSLGKYVDLSATYYGNNNIYNTPTAFVGWDAHAGYALKKNVSLVLSFTNITGAYDQPIENYNPSRAVPVIPGANGYYQGAIFASPYQARSLTLNVAIKE
jgi:outer membrane receptor protein involved in Fe transport